MQAPWLLPFHIETLDANWAARSIHRLAGVDPRGMLSVGKAGKLGYRRLPCWHGEPPARGCLYVALKVAAGLWGTPGHAEQDVATCLSHLAVQVATSVPAAELEAAERAGLYADL